MNERPEDETTEEEDPDVISVDEETQGRIFRFARKLMDRKDLGVDAREVLHTMAATSDKAKTEAMRLIAREVRNYLDEMRLEELVHQVLQSYTVDVSIRLNPIEGGSEENPPGAEPTPDVDEAADTSSADPETE